VRIPRDAVSASPPARAAVNAASPVPSATPPPPGPATAAPSPAPSAPAPALSVPRLLDLGPVTRGTLTLTAGPQAVTWTLSATDGIQVTENGAPVTGGVLTAGQELDLAAWAPRGGGVIYVSAGPRTWAVVVSSDLSPAGPPAS